jgi:protein ImuB
MPTAPPPRLPWLALRFPFLPADRLCALGAAPAEPFALVARTGNALRLAAVSPGALALGLHPGLTLADARARVPALASAAHDPAADAAWLRRLARRFDWATPTIALQPPDALLLEIGASTHLFGGAPALAARLKQELGAVSAHLALGLGTTPDAALAFARFPGAAGDWRRLPVAALGLDAEAEAGLRRAGLALVGEVARQPSAAIAARFGLQAVKALGFLHEQVRPLKLRRPPPRLAFEARLAEPLLTTDAAHAVLAELYARAARRLARLGRGGRRFEAAFDRADGAVQRLAVESGRPLRDPRAIARLFDERIEGLADPLDPGFGYDRIALAVSRHEPLAVRQPQLGEARDAAPDALDAALDRLSIRFGADSFLTLLPLDSHLPEASEARRPARDGEAPAWGRPAIEDTDPPLRPLFLFDPPEPVEVLAEVPDGPPHRFRWRRTQHRVALAEGPERIAPDWWRLASGALEGGRVRDYWRVEDMDGRRYWLFRAGLYGEVGAAARWYLHGLFA